MDRHPDSQVDGRTAAVGCPAVQVSQLKSCPEPQRVVTGSPEHYDLRSAHAGRDPSTASRLLSPPARTVGGSLNTKGVERISRPSSTSSALSVKAGVTPPGPTVLGVQTPEVAQRVVRQFQSREIPGNPLRNSGNRPSHQPQTRLPAPQKVAAVTAKSGKSPASNGTGKSAAIRTAVFRGYGALALHGSVIGSELEVLPTQPNVLGSDGFVRVFVRGPLMNHASPLFDSYDAIRDRVRAALASKPKGIALVIDSPGGVLTGSLEIASTLRSLCAGARVPLVAYVDGCATSAAYVLACAASRIGAGAASMLGSVGVAMEVLDRSVANAMAGMNVRVIASAARKLDGHPAVTPSDDSIAALQGQVDQLGQVMFAHVAKLRGMTSEQVRTLEGRTLIGLQAKAVGLIDHVGSLQELIAKPVQSTKPVTAAPAAKGPKATMKTNLRDVERRMSTAQRIQELKSQISKLQLELDEMLKGEKQASSSSSVAPRADGVSNRGLTAAQAERLDRAFGLNSKPAIYSEGNTRCYGAMTSAEANEILAQRAKERGAR